MKQRKNGNYNIVYDCYKNLVPTTYAGSKFPRALVDSIT